MVTPSRQYQEYLFPALTAVAFSDIAKGCLRCDLAACGDEETTKKPRLFQFRKDASSSREALHVVFFSSILVISRGQFENLRPRKFGSNECTRDNTFTDGAGGEHNGSVIGLMDASRLSFVAAGRR
jgi:hypothetical protein